jgi:hypothetical protein
MRSRSGCTSRHNAEHYGEALGKFFREDRMATTEKRKPILLCFVVWENSMLVSFLTELILFTLKIICQVNFNARYVFVH